MELPLRGDLLLKLTFTSCLIVRWQSDSRFYSQKMLVMSESRLKIQITSGAEISTNDQDTPLSDWRSFNTPTQTAPPPDLCSSSSSSRVFGGQKQTGQSRGTSDSLKTREAPPTCIWLPGSM